MPRAARVVGVGLPHHVTQRGNYQQKVFDSEADREQYIALICKYSKDNSLSVLCYCLMDNHVHFLVVPKEADSLAISLKCAHVRYAQYFNNKHRVTGHLWKGRFYSCVLDANHMLMAARYIERNPVRAGLVKYAEEWKWSSAAFHCGMSNAGFAFELDKLWQYIGMEQSAWREFLREPEPEGDILDIRACTNTGRPFGDSKFVGKLEREFGYRLHALPEGRPKVAK